MLNFNGVDKEQLKTMIRGLTKWYVKRGNTEVGEPNASVGLLYDDVMFGIDRLPSVTPQEPRWIPITKRPMTEDEKARHEFYYDEAEILDCSLPEDGEDVLITVNGRTWIDTFIRDDADGCYFESYDIDEVKAWMPLPKPYKGVEDGNDD